MATIPSMRTAVAASFLLLACGSSGVDGAADAGAADAPPTAHDAAASLDAAADGARPSDPSDASHGPDAPALTDAGSCTPLPTTGLYATFKVVSDVFYTQITKPSGITGALALWKGTSNANIPSGTLDCTSGAFNCGYDWHLKPDSIDFAEITIEVCDGTPSYVQANCASFPNGSYCPWSAELIALRDCRTDPSCPAVPR